MPIAAPYGVMVEYSFGVSATSICAPSSGESRSGRWGFLRRIPFEPTSTVCTWGWRCSWSPWLSAHRASSDEPPRFRKAGIMVAMVCEMLHGRHCTFGAVRRRLAHPRFLVVLLSVVAAACSATGSNAPTSTRPQTPDLKAMLVTARELPPGYSAAPADSGIPPCNFQQVLTDGAVGRAQVSFASDPCVSG